MASAAHPKYTFDTEFFEVVGGGVRTPVAAPQVQGGARGLEAARQQAFAEGHAAGLAEGQQQAQADLARLQQHLQNTLVSLQDAVNQREETLIRHMLGLLQQTLEALVGHALTVQAPGVLEHHLRALLPLAKTEESLVLRVHPAARGYHEKLALPQANILGLPLRVMSDSSLGPVDAVVEWQHGGVEARMDDHLAAVRALLTGAGALDLPPHELGVLVPPQDSAAGLAATSSSQVMAPSGASVAPSSATPPEAAPPPPALDPIAEAQRKAEQERASRAAALLGDDELVDALK